MASAQFHKPCEQTHHQHVQSSTVHKTTDIHYDKNHGSNEHSFSDKLKEVAHKMFNHQEHSKVPNHAHKPATNCSTGTAHYGEKNKVKPTYGHEKHCMPKMHKKKNKKSKAGKHGGCSSDSGSSSDSD